MSHSSTNSYVHLQLYISHFYQVSFSTSGDLLLTASADHTARIWLAESGSCLQVLSGHTDEVYACTFSYNQDMIITASKDNQCLFWRRYDWYTPDA